MNTWFSWKTLVLALVAGILFVSPLARADSATSGTFGNDMLGGAYNVTFVDELSKDRRHYTASLTSKVDANLFRWKIPVADGNASLDVTKPGNRVHATTSLKLVGKTVFDYDKTFANSMSWKTAPFYQKKAGGTLSFDIGPFELELTAEAEIEIYGKGDLKVEWAVGRDPICFISAGPAADVAGNASVDLDLLLVDVGVAAEIELVGAGVVANVSLMPRSSTKTTTLRAEIAAELESAHGELSAWVKLRYLFGSKKWDKTIAEFNGGPYRRVLEKWQKEL